MTTVEALPIVASAARRNLTMVPQIDPDATG
jgi:hypothetical protein